MMEELDSLAMQAANLDGEVASAAPGAMLEQQEQAAVISMAEQNSRGVSMIMALAVPILSKLYPSLAEVYTPEACGQVAASLGPVLAKYGVNLEEWGGRYQEEIAALFVCGPIAWATVQGVKADIASRAPAKAVQMDKAQQRVPVTPPPVMDHAVLGTATA